MTGTGIRYGAILPGGTAPEQLAQAELAERAGWDGVFSWETGYGVDPWTLLAAIAARTSRVRLGTILTPLPFRRPWKLASQVATLDQLSGGRAILAVGLGAMDTNLPDTGEETDLKIRAARLDEGIDLIQSVWSGGGQYDGEHYRFHSGRFDLATAVRPVQQPIPIWVAARWPRPKSLRRALRGQGVLPEFMPEGREQDPDDVRALRAWLAEHGAPDQLDVVLDGETPADDPAAAAAQVKGWADAGLTWWLESRWGMPDTQEERIQQMTERLAAGPPRS
ncbi:MAG TPA: LLM class flavin-dependent oxidoreductase [Streptosporangiaceae bacterium]|nr:LLM class flavin-dependent oxidoreductase [Streptosporangiaceae bacterium]